MSTYNDEYEKLSLLGQGAFASIWKVRHRRLGYVRALKELNMGIENEDSPAFISFLNECGLLMRIGNGAHPGIVRVYQPRLISNKATVEMDFVDGLTINEYIREKIFVGFDEVMRFVREVTDALAYCHVDVYKDMMNPLEDQLKRNPDDARQFIINQDDEQRLIQKYGVVHNDLHSNNIMRRNRDGRFVLLDFGLAIQNGNSVKSSSRMDGAVEYKAPEKWDNEEYITTMSDIYSLGILFFEMLAGAVPFPFGQNPATGLANLVGMMKMHKYAEIPAIEPLRKKAFEQTHPGQAYVKDYPDWLEQTIRKCLAKRPEERFHDAKELQTHINQFDNQQQSPTAPQQQMPEDALEQLLKSYISQKPDISAKEILDALQPIKERQTDKPHAAPIIKDTAKAKKAYPNITTFTVGGISFNMVKVDGGKYTMGATGEAGIGAGDKEKPPHEVFVRTFLIGQAPVTQELWTAVMGSNPSKYQGKDHPVESVSWNDCQEFIRRLNLLTGQSFRLPNEEEWEFAARGGLKSQGFTFAGSNDIGQVAWYEANSGMTTQPVATKAPNELGLYDMSGNIFEWCHNNFYRYDTPSNPTTGKTRRGGGWNSSPKNCRVSFRYDNEPDKRSQIIGMRLAI